MEIIAASNEITLLLALGFGVLSVWDIAANVSTPVLLALAVLAVRSFYVLDTAVR